MEMLRKEETEEATPDAVLPSEFNSRRNMAAGTTVATDGDASQRCGWRRAADSNWQWARQI